MSVALVASAALAVSAALAGSAGLAALVASVAMERRSERLLMSKQFLNCMSGEPLLKWKAQCS